VCHLVLPINGCDNSDFLQREIQQKGSDIGQFGTISGLTLARMLHRNRF
jgi:hypothetical protein